MRLCFVCTEKHPVPAVKGGAIQILIDGVSPILKKKHDITIFSVSDPTLPKQEKTNGIQYFRLPRSNYIARVAKKIASKTFDVIHVFNRPKYVMKLKKAAPNSRFVLSLHNEMFHPSKTQQKRGKRSSQLWRRS
ncbi:hypothetical protein [Caldalkalibacillus mannanilyticus]|uniref:hypothetical protein n=1 Tax=Caldalkalibacillus mannanilyticus TaxID=1418 RepID=UPI001F272F56|nr:hypothetical protein [Caldalkalibacillus mannanilyticus]